MVGAAAGQLQALPLLLVARKRRCMVPSSERPRLKNPCCAALLCCAPPLLAGFPADEVGFKVGKYHHRSGTADCLRSSPRVPAARLPAHVDIAPAHPWRLQARGDDSRQRGPQHQPGRRGGAQGVREALLPGSRRAPGQRDHLHLHQHPGRPLHPGPTPALASGGGQHGLLKKWPGCRCLFGSLAAPPVGDVQPGEPPRRLRRHSFPPGPWPLCRSSLPRPAAGMASSLPPSLAASSPTWPSAQEGAAGTMPTLRCTASAGAGLARQRCWMRFWAKGK